MRNSKTRLLLVLTLVVAVVTTLLVYKYLNGLRQTAADEVMGTVVVPVKKIPQGTRITPEMLKSTQLPTKYIPTGAAAAKEAVVNKYAVNDIFPEETIVPGQVASENTASELPYKVPPGLRAITIAINPLTGVAGHVKPGHYVDVLMTYKKTETELKVITLLQKVLVLAVGADLQKKEGAMPSENITLAVSPRDAQLVTLTENVGKLRLVLRPPSDQPDNTLTPIDLKGFQSMY